MLDPRRMIPVALVLVLALALPATADTLSRSGGHALLFGIDNWLSVEEFQGATVSYQRFISDNVAWRVGVGIDLYYSTGEYQEGNWGTSHEGYGAGDTETWSHSLSFVSQWLVFRGDRISAFYGGGPYLSYGRSRSERPNLSGDDWILYWDDSETYTIGLQGTLGTQWTVTDWLALHAEYRVVGGYRHSSEEHRRVVSEGDFSAVASRTTSEGLIFDTMNVRFGMSIYL